MQEKINILKQWLTDSEVKYDNHKVERSGLYMHDLIVEQQRLFTEIVTLKKVLGIVSKEDNV